MLVAHAAELGLSPDDAQHLDLNRIYWTEFEPRFLPSNGPVGYPPRTNPEAGKFVRAIPLSLDGKRQLVSSRPLLTVFRETIAGNSLPAFDHGTVEITTHPQAGTDPSPLPEFRDQRALDKLEKALREGARDFFDLFKRAEANYWDKPSSPHASKPRRELLATEMTKALRAEADLRHRDGTLDDTSYRMVTAFADRYTDPARDNTSADLSAQIYTPYLTYTDTKHATQTVNIPGALVLTQRSITTKRTPDGTQLDGGKMVLLVPGQGIKTFDSEASLDAALKKQFAPHAPATATTNYVQRSDDAITLRVQDMLKTSSDQWMHAFHTARGKPLTSGGIATFGQQLDRANSIASRVDTQGAIRARNAALVEQAMPDWLRNAKPEKKAAWANANQAYLETLKHTPPLDAKSLGNPALVRKYARYRLRQTLKLEHGISLDPDNIKITRTWYEAKPGLEPHIQVDPHFPLYEARSETKTLTDLSLTNISWYDAFGLPRNSYEVTDEQGRPISGLDFRRVRDIVQRTDAGGSYDEALKRLVTEKSRSDYARVLDAGMRVQLLESQMRDLVSDDGAALVDIALDQPDATTRARLRGGTVTVSQLLIGGATVNGVKLFETNPLNNGPLVLYTPDAPDGKIFREYRDRGSMWNDIKSMPQMRSYLTQRTGQNDAGNVARILAGKDNASVQASLITGNFLKQSFEADVALSRANANAQTVSNKEILLQDIKGGILLTYDVASIFLPVKLTLPLALGRAIHSAWDAGHALRQGDHDEALTHAVDALVTLAFDVAADGAGYRWIKHSPPPVLSKGADNRFTMRVDTSPAASSLPDPALRAFEQKGLDTTKLKAGADDVYTLPGKHEQYVQIGEGWYASAEDKGRRFVHMPSEDGLSATWPIHRTANKWQFTPLDELPGHPIPADARIPERYRAARPADLPEADARGIFSTKGQDYIEINQQLYRTGQDGNGRYIYDGNPLHRIRVRRNGRHWEIVPPSFGRGGQRSGPIKIIQDIYNMNPSEARAFLDRYQFPTSGPYTEHNFTLAIAYTDEVPAWADQFRRSSTTSPGGVAGAGASSPSTLTPKPDQADDGLPDFARIHEGNASARGPGGAKDIDTARVPDFPVDPGELATRLDNAAHAQAARRIVSRDEPDGFSISTGYGNVDRRSTFVADYQPGVWSLHDLARHKSMEGVYTSDIIREQYRKVSMNQNFFGRLPSKLAFTNVQNDEAKKLIRRHIGSHAKPGTYAADDILQAFMTTELGKIVPRIGGDFDLEAYGMKVVVTENHKLIAELSVRPTSFKD